MSEPMAEGPPVRYPEELEREVVLPDGARLRVRPIRQEDESRLMEFHERLSRRTAYQRFFTVMRRLPPNLAHFPANVDFRRRLALVVEHEPGRTGRRGPLRAGRPG
jgi:acetyltransferase